MTMNKAARIAALVLAVLLAAGYAFLPCVEERMTINNSGRKKEEIPTDGQLSWSWTPQFPQVDSVSFSLSGKKKASGMTVHSAALDAEGQEIATVSQAIDDLGDGDEVKMTGPFDGGKTYTLTLWAEGEGTIKVKGEESDEGDYYPQLQEYGQQEERNPVVLYFALGFLMLSLVPLRENQARPRPVVRRENIWMDTLLPWGTFLLIAGIGILVSTHKPPFNGGGDWGGWDEEVHQKAIAAMTPLGSGSFREWLGSMITWNPGYVPLALGQTLAGFFTRNSGELYRASIMASSLCYAVMAALAVKHAPRYKVTFLAAGTIPTIMFLMTSMTYDTVVIGSILLGISLALESMEMENISPLRAMTMVAILTFGTVAKPAYSLAMIILLALPKEALGGKRQAWIFRVYVVLMLAWCMLALVVPGAYDDIRGGDERFADANASEQIAYLLSSPEALFFPVRYFWSNQDFLMNMGIAHWAYLGNNGYWNDLFLALMLFIAPLCASGEDMKRKSSLTWGRRLILILIAFGAELALVYTQYVVSSPVGGWVQGMQARYFIPLWIAAALAVMAPQALRKRVDPRVSHLLTGIAFLATCWVNITYAVGWLTGTGYLG